MSSLNKRQDAETSVAETGELCGAAPPPTDGPKSSTEQKASTQLVERSLQKILTVLFLAAIVAWVLTVSSQHIWINMPAALALVGSLGWLLQQHEARVKAGVLSSQAYPRRFGSAAGHKALQQQQPQSPSSQQHVRAHHHSRGSSLGGAADSKGRADRWRKSVGSDIVAQAWEVLCGSILQEFVYDLWWSSMTPDTEFPKDIRRVLNGAFGELASRAKRTDLRSILLWEVSELVVAQLRLLRDTRASIVGDDEDAWALMPPAARDRALANELRAERKLHAALYPPAPDGSIALGHYAVLQQIAQGTVNCLMDRDDAAKPMMRSVARDLLSTCVLRPIVHLFTPYNIHKMLLSALQQRVARKQVSMDAETAAAAAAISANDMSKSEKGTWEFRMRLQNSLAMENATASATLHGSLPSSMVQAGEAGSSPRQQRSGSARPTRSMTPPPFARPPSSDWLGPAAAPATPFDPSSPFRRSGSDSNLKRAVSAAEPINAPRMYHSEHGLRARPSAGLESASSLNVAPVRRPVYAEDRSRRHTDSPHAAQSKMSQAESQAVWPSPPRPDGGASEPLARPPTSQRSRPHDALGSRSATPPYRRSEGDVRNAMCFLGSPKAQVVVAEMAAESGREVVVYKVRVADARGEWTVSRRFRSFEGLHRALREQLGANAYTLKLPAKRIFNHGQGVAFVEERRTQLNAYLSQIMSDPVLFGHPEVWDFLSENSEAYGPASEVSFLKGLVRDANTSMRRAVGDMVDNMDSQRKRIISAVPTMNLPLPEAPWTSSRPNAEPPQRLGSLSSISTRPQGQGLYDPRTSPDGGPRTTPASRASSGSMQGEGAQAFRGSILQYTRMDPSSSAAASPEGSQGSHCNSDGHLISHRGSGNGSRPGQSSPAQSDAQTGQHRRTRSGPPPEPGHVLSAESSGDSGRQQAQHTHNRGGPASTTSPEPPNFVEPAARASLPDMNAAAAAWEDESAGISEPLYGILDELFRMQGRGFIRPLVYSWGRQALSLFAGGAIDDWVQSHMRMLRQEHFLARKLLQLQAFLWPSGSWFMSAAWHAAPKPDPQKPPPPKVAMTPENFIHFGGAQPIDADEIKEAVERLILSGAPPAVTRVVGRAAYESGMRDALDLVQSQTFVLQLAYGLLEILLGSLFPELEPLLIQARHGPPG